VASVALTGGTSGLGLALVRQLHARGALVAFEARTAATVAEVAARHPGTHGIQLLRAFLPDAILRRVNAALERLGNRSHEFADAVLIPRHQPAERRSMTPTPAGTPGVGLETRPVRAGDETVRSTSGRFRSPVA
jgi:hypothetical protein